MSSFDPIVEEWNNNRDVGFFENLNGSELYPSACTEWGDSFIENLPVIIDDGILDEFHELFNYQGHACSYVVLDHNMTLRFHNTSSDSVISLLNETIEELLVEMENDPIVNNPYQLGIHIN